MLTSSLHGVVIDNYRHIVNNRLSSWSSPRGRVALSLIIITVNQVVRVIDKVINNIITNEAVIA